MENNKEEHMKNSRIFQECHVLLERDKTERPEQNVTLTVIFYPAFPNVKNTLQDPVNFKHKNTLQEPH